MSTLVDHLPAMQATIDRRIFVTFCADPEAMRPLVPDRYELRLTDGWAIGGVCLLRLTNMRPNHLPRWVGISSDNAAHRISIVGADGEPAIWAPRRDTSSHVLARLGRSMYPDAPGTALFDVHEHGNQVSITATDTRGHAVASIDGERSTTPPETSLFADANAIGAYYRAARTGYSPANDDGPDGLIDVAVADWTVTPLSVRTATSAVFDPLVAAGRAELDHVVMMQNVASTWRFDHT